jgi:hypothetical protein
MGDTIRTITVQFDHPDAGIIWNLDEDNCVVIQQIEKNSPADGISELINGLRLLRINNKPITLYDRKSLDTLQNELVKLHEEEMELEFLEPLVCCEIENLLSNLIILKHIVCSL